MLKSCALSFLSPPPPFPYLTLPRSLFPPSVIMIKSCALPFSTSSLSPSLSLTLSISDSVLFFFAVNLSHYLTSSNFLCYLFNSCLPLLFTLSLPLCLSSFRPLSTLSLSLWGGGGAVARSVERSTPGEEIPGSIPAVAARSLLIGSVSV